MDSSPSFDDEQHQFILDTVADNLKLYTKREQADAKLARIAFHGTGRNPIDKTKAYLRGGYIRDCPVLAEDIDNAVAIFGPDVSKLKGTSTRPHPPRV